MASLFSHTPFRLIAVLCAAVTLSQFYRMSVGVIGPDLTAELGLTAAALGTLGGSYFLVFAAVQVPAGVALDRFGPRAVNAALMVVAAAGALIFAFAPGAASLVFGRSVIGLGCATAYIGALVLFARWAPPERFSILAATAIGTGSIGGLLATTPLAVVAETVGWRSAFIGVAAITLAVAGLVWLVVRDAPPGRPDPADKRETLAQTVRGLGEVLGNRQLYFLLPINSVSYAAIAAVLGLWGAPYLKDVQGLAIVDGANLLLVFSVMLIVSSFGYGWLAPRVKRLQALAAGGAVIVVAMFALLALMPPSDPAWLYALLVVMGLAGGYPVVLVSHVRKLFPVRLMGRGLTVANLFNFGGVGVVQVISGWIIDAYPTIDGANPPAAYSTLFWCLAAVVGTSAVIYLFGRPVNLADTH